MKVKKRRKLFKKRFLIEILILFLEIIFLFSFLNFSDYFKIKEISFSSGFGERKEIENFLFKKFSGSLIFTSSKKIKDALFRKFPQFKEIKIEKKFPHRLEIILKKREPKIYGCFENDCGFLDEEGVFFKTSFKKEILKIKIEKRKAEEGEIGLSSFFIENILKIDKELESFFPEKKNYLLVDSYLKVKTSGKDLYFDLNRDLEETFTKLKALFSTLSQKKWEKISYIDLRFKKVYLK